MAVTEAENPLLGEITCGTLLQKLQVDFATYTLILLIYGSTNSMYKLVTGNLG